MATIVQLKEDLETLERDLNTRLALAALHVERTYGYKLRLNLTENVEKPIQLSVEVKTGQ